MNLCSVNLLWTEDLLKRCRSKNKEAQICTASPPASFRRILPVPRPIGRPAEHPTVQHGSYFPSSMFITCIRSLNAYPWSINELIPACDSGALSFGTCGGDANPSQEGDRSSFAARSTSSELRRSFPASQLDYSSGMQSLLRKVDRVRTRFLRRITRRIVIQPAESVGAR